MSSVTMQQVADAAGVHQTTVSLALRNHPRISKATRHRIRRIANEMGYVPNPMVSALISNRKRPNSQIRATLGYIIGDSTKAVWPYPDLDTGIRERAQELGFGLDTFWLQEEPLARQRFSRITETRNIRGLIVAPLIERHSTLDLNWEQYASVAYGYSMVEPKIHRVAPDFYHDMLIVLKYCVEAGCRKIGIILNEYADLKADHLWLAAFLAEQKIEPRLGEVPPLILRGWDETALKSWFLHYQPDAVISLSALLERAETWHSKWSQNKGSPTWLSLDALTQTKPGHFAGAAIDRRATGRACVDLVVSLLYRNAVGLPEKVYNLLIQGDWIDKK